MCSVKCKNFILFPYKIYPTFDWKAENAAGYYFSKYYCRYIIIMYIEVLKYIHIYAIGYKKVKHQPQENRLI